MALFQDMFDTGIYTVVMWCNSGIPSLIIIITLSSILITDDKWRDNESSLQCVRMCVCVCVTICVVTSIHLPADRQTI